MEEKTGEEGEIKEKGQGAKREEISSEYTSGLIEQQQLRRDGRREARESREARGARRARPRGGRGHGPPRGTIQTSSPLKFLIMEAFAIINASHAAELLNADTPSFQALDCQAMVVNSVRSIPKGCLKNSQTPKTPEPQGIRTVGLYKAIKSITATHCSVTESRLILHCGMFSHNSAIAPIQIARPKTVNKEACKKMKNEGIFIDKRGRIHQVNKLGTTFINYVEIGELVYSHHQARCIGGKVNIDNVEVEGAMVLADIKVTVKEEITNINPDGNLMIPEMHLLIPKRMIRDDAVSLGLRGAILFPSLNGSTAECPYRLLGYVNVNDQKAPGNQTLFYNDAHKLFFLGMDALRQHRNCDKGLWRKTNLKHIVLRELVQGDQQKETQLEDINLRDLIVEVADFSMMTLRTEMAAMEARFHCAFHLHSLRSNLVATDPDSPGAITFIRGELLIAGRCHVVQVKHDKGQDTCFTELPVLHKGERRFLEPVTRILRKESKQIPCQSALQAYQDSKGRWHRADQHLTEINAPKTSFLDPRTRNADTVATSAFVNTSAPANTAGGLLLHWIDASAQTNITEELWTPEHRIWPWGSHLSLMDFVRHLGWAIPIAATGFSLGMLLLLCRLGSTVAMITGVMQGCRVDRHLGTLSIRHLFQVVFCGAYAAGRRATEGRRQADPNWEERVATVTAARRALRQARGDTMAGPVQEGTQTGLPLHKPGQGETSL